MKKQTKSPTVKTKKASTSSTPSKSKVSKKTTGAKKEIKKAAVKKIKKAAVKKKLSVKSVAAPKVKKSGLQKKASKKVIKKVVKKAKVTRLQVKSVIERESQSVTLTDLPLSYGETKIVLLPRDPQCVFSYWDYSQETWAWIQDFFYKDPNAMGKLRFYVIDEDECFDVDIHIDPRQWYVHLDRADLVLEAELGILSSKGKFYVIARSNRVHTPRDVPSVKIDSEWDPRGLEDLYRSLSGDRRHSAGSIESIP